MRGQDPADFQASAQTELPLQAAPIAWYDDPRLAQVKPKGDEVKQERRRKVARGALAAAVFVGGGLLWGWLSDVGGGQYNTDGSNPNPHSRARRR